MDAINVFEIESPLSEFFWSCVFYYNSVQANWTWLVLQASWGHPIQEIIWYDGMWSSQLIQLNYYGFLLKQLWWILVTVNSIKLAIV